MKNSNRNPVTVCQADTCVTVTGKLGEALALIIVIGAGVALITQIARLLK